MLSGNMKSVPIAPKSYCNQHECKMCFSLDDGSQRHRMERSRTTRMHTANTSFQMRDQRIGR